MSAVTSITRVKMHPEEALRGLDRGASRAHAQIGSRILDSAGPRAPRDTGELASSGVMEADEEGVAVGYEAAHAVYVRGKGVALGGKDPRWLDHAVEEVAGEAPAIYGDEISREWS